ncbi:hypothetical protein V6N11_042481 [Hibiscus sabdariffa]|uniref:Uncharacterized protein n=1 Tax=Hibiscus sabdariffa TaxID=183260 RepID=A0ABR2QWQ0_9ROSI
MKLRFPADTFRKGNEHFLVRFPRLMNRIRITGILMQLPDGDTGKICKLLFSGLGSISESDLPCDILSSMRRKPKGHTQLSQIPEKLNVALHGHAKAVNAVHWSPTHGQTQIVDVRTGKVVHEYIRGLGPILDVEFSTDGKQFVPSSDVSGGNISENSIIIWDISRQVPLSNQGYVSIISFHMDIAIPDKLDRIFGLSFSTNVLTPKVYAEAYTCPCVSLDGEKLASGSSDGSIYFYNSRSSVLIKKIKAYEEACVDVAFHPILSNVTASCSWNGDVSVFE